MSEPLYLLSVVGDHLQGVVAGRTWRGRIPKGSASRTLYRGVQAGLVGSGLYGADQTPAGRQEAAVRWMASDDAWALAVQTIQGWTVTEDGAADVVADDTFDVLFAGQRITEVLAVASSAWEVLGYLTMPGTLSAMPGAPRPTPSSSDSPQS